MSHRSWPALLILMVLAACDPPLDAPDGSVPALDAPIAPGDDVPILPGVDGGACITSCPSRDLCGFYVDACGAVIDCGRCAFDTQGAPGRVDDGGFSAVRLASGEIMVAHLRSGQIVIAHWMAGVWGAEEVIDTDGFVASLALAVAPDGARWLASRTSVGLLSVYFAAPGSDEWIGSWLDVQASAFAIALDAEGTPWVVLADPVGNRVDVATFDGSDWTRETAMNTDADHGVALVVRGGNPIVAVASRDAVLFALRAGGTWMMETVSDAPSSSVALLLDAAGEPWVLGEIDAMMAFQRAGGAWIQSTYDDDETNLAVGGALSGAFDAAGVLWMASGEGPALLAARTDEGIPRQRLHAGYCRSPVVVFADGPGELLVVDACDERLEVHERMGLVPAETAAACDAAVDAVCTEVCDGTCAIGCCWAWDSDRGGSGTACQSRLRCEIRMSIRLCGDVAITSAEPAACATDIASAACEAEHVVFPPSCADTY